MPRTACLALLLVLGLCAQRAAAQAVALPGKPGATSPMRPLDLTPGVGVNTKGQEAIPAFGIKGTEAQLIVTIKINPKAGPNCTLEKFIALRRQSVTDALKMLKLSPAQANLMYIQGTAFPDVAATAVTANLKWYTVSGWVGVRMQLRAGQLMLLPGVVNGNVAGHWRATATTPAVHSSSV